jgi:putative drug exporter of the RND superfamily
VVVGLALAVAAGLMEALRAIVLPLVAVASDLLVALATFGVLALLFGGHDPVLGGPGYLDPMSVVGIFAAIFGSAMVYAVMLLGRTRERYLESGDPDEALAFGLRHSAPVATGAAIVTLAAAVPFVFSDLLDARQLGVGVAAAVGLEALTVRPVLLPAAIRLLGRRAWWPTGRPAVRRRAAAPPPAPTGGAAPA